MAVKKLNRDDRQDLAIIITNKLIELGYVPDCTDTDDDDEFIVQDTIADILKEKRLYQKFNKINLENWEVLLIFVLSNSINMNNVDKFFQLQTEVNQQIDEQGQVSEQLANQLEALGDSLNEQEIEEVCERARAERLYEQGLRHY